MKYTLTEVKSFTTATGKVMYFLKLSDGNETVEASTFDDMSNTKAGDVINGDVTISDKKDKNGNPYKNFKQPRPEMVAITNRLDDLEQRMSLIDGDNVPDAFDKVDKQVEKYSDEGQDINIDDIPF